MVRTIGNFFSSVVKFVKSSFMSIIVLIIMFYLLTKVKQGASMVISLVEQDLWSLLWSFFFINGLAFSLSHFPIYTYYAANLNDSDNGIKWERIKIIPYFHITIFKTEFSRKYRFDLTANVLRYLNGLFVFIIWGCILIYGYEKNLNYDGSWSNELYWLVSISGALCLIWYAVQKNKKIKFAQAKKNAEDTGDTDEVDTIQVKNNRLNYQLSRVFLITSLLFLMAMVTIIYLVLANKGYSKWGLTVLLFANFCLILLYFVFRLIRQDFGNIIAYIRANKLNKIVRVYAQIFKFSQRYEFYLLILFFNFLFALGFIICAHIQVFNMSELENGIPILFAYFCVYTFLISSIFKFFFVSQHKLKKRYLNNSFNSKYYKTARLILGIGLIVLGGLFAIGNFSESEMHQLSQVKVNPNIGFIDKDLVEHFNKNQDSVVFFIAAQGGGLKGNYWTLKVLNRLQKETNGGLFKHTAVLSGASGGSLGLGLYTTLFNLHGDSAHQIEVLESKIDSISKGNYTSVDLTLLLGWDLLRKMAPFNLICGNCDRDYYKMRMFQNVINDSTNMELSKQDFRSVWVETFNKQHYYPSLIINTSAMNGRRGIFWSHKATEGFENIFPNAIDLLSFSEDSISIPYYQAVSTTNRFPFLSAAAKIKEKGYFIDAGAVDNSGLMGCLDVYRYLKKEGALVGKRVVFIEIMNGETTYSNIIIEANKLTPIIDEFESSTFKADVSAGVNLDIMPDYLSGLVKSMAKNNDSINYIPVFLPHRTSLAEIEARLGGKIMSEIEACSVRCILALKNEMIYDLTERNKSFTEPWHYMEPPLSRHFSQSNINYGDTMFFHPEVRAQIDTIRKLSELNDYVIVKDK